MIFHVLRYVLLFFLPFLAYGIWLAAARRRAEGHENEPGWSDAPFVWLTVAGLGLAIAGFFALGLNQGEDREGNYVPPRIVDGQIVPGEVQRGE